MLFFYQIYIFDVYIDKQILVGVDAKVQNVSEVCLKSKQFGFCKFYMISLFKWAGKRSF